MTPLKTFALRNTKETLRDPLNMIFTLAFPIFLLLMMAFIQSKAPEAIFPMGRLAPGMALFGFSFVALNTGLLIGQDRNTSFLARLFSSPLTASDFIWGYTLPQVCIAIAQSVVCFGVAMLIGLTPSWNILFAIITLIPSTLLFVGAGMLFGSIFNDKQVGGVFSLFINVVAFMNGMWIPLDVVGGVFSDICYALPFVHAFDMARYVLAGDFATALPHLWWVLGYTVVVIVAAIAAFRRKMNA